MAKISNEPRLRQYLVLAYQIQDVLDKDGAKSLLQIAEWLNMTYTRIKQITNLLSLCPEIQKEILLSNTDKIRHITERKIRSITKEINWQKQIEAWNELI
jgi:phosphomannomutase